MDGRDEAFFENPLVFIRNRQAHQKSFNQICLMIPTLGMVCSHTGNTAVPVWEYLLCLCMHSVPVTSMLWLKTTLFHANSLLIVIFP